MARTCFRTNKPQTTTAIIVKFLCSYGGKILPRYPDGKLRYYGGETRVLAVDRFISFSELSVKLEELCGTPVALLRCQLPSEDLDALVSITSDEDLVNLIEEYERTQQQPPDFKVRAFLSLPKNPSSPISSPIASCSPPRFRTNHCTQQMLKEPKKLQFCHKKLSAGNLLRYACANSSQSYVPSS
uniref:uncharacterized protein LOC122578371 n=1 Tax=Erigeron canadensis TaxID=72917 RepID=UPI001CB92E00|nr:uncharacterized protein LOC122578371 [Erigeron canadensis]